MLGYFNFMRLLFCAMCSMLGYFSFMCWSRLFSYFMFVCWCSMLGYFSFMWLLFCTCFSMLCYFNFIFFFIDTACTKIYSLSLLCSLPILSYLSFVCWCSMLGNLNFMWLLFCTCCSMLGYFNFMRL